MKSKGLEKFKSVENFKSEIEETKTLIFALETQVMATKELLTFVDAKSEPPPAGAGGLPPSFRV